MIKKSPEPIQNTTNSSAVALAMEMVMTQRSLYPYRPKTLAAPRVAVR